MVGEFAECLTEYIIFLLEYKRKGCTRVWSRGLSDALWIVIRAAEQKTPHKSEAKSRPVAEPAIERAMTIGNNLAPESAEPTVSTGIGTTTLASPIALTPIATAAVSPAVQITPIQPANAPPPATTIEPGRTVQRLARPGAHRWMG